MADSKYVAYVGTYTHETSVGIYVYNVDPETGVLTEQSVAPINNPSDIINSKDNKFLYSMVNLWRLFLVWQTVPTKRYRSSQEI